MDNAIPTILHWAVLGFVALFPAVNPIGTALVVDPLLNGLSPLGRQWASARIAFYCFVVCATTLLLGNAIFKLFGISLPVVQAAGGLLICRMGWTLLSSDTNTKGDEEMSRPQVRQKIERILFYPLTFPMTTGAGTISVLLTLSAQTQPQSVQEKVLLPAALLTAAFLMCVVIYGCYAYTPVLMRRIGPSGAQVLNRLSAFLVFCVGLQIAATGLAQLFTP